MKRKIKGFTLVELIVVITIVVILSMISVPLYQGHTKKAMMTEGYALISAIREAQFAYRSEYGTFLYNNYPGSGRNLWDLTCNDNVLGINARLNKYFTLFLLSSVHPNDGKKSAKYDLAISVLKPKEIRKNGDYLRLYYCLTGRVAYQEGNDLYVQ